MAEKKQINLRIPADTKQEWQEYGEEKYGGLTRLIQTAVTREIGGDYDGSSGGETGASADVIEEVAENTNSIKDTVDRLENRLAVVQENQQSGADISVRAAVKETLPGRGHGLRPEQVAARLDADTETVQDTLETLWEQDPEVVFTERDDGRKLYWNRGEN